MSGLYAILLASPALLMLVVGVIPNSHANRRAGLLRRLVPLLLVWQFVSVVAFELRLGSGPLVANGQVGVVPIGIFLDGVSALMMGMVSLVGWVICTYSIRYLDSDPDQGRYFRWASFTIGSVLMLVVSGNLAMFACFWIATSMGLHQLLVQRGDRAAATRAAWTKFGISRIGDAALIFAVFLIHSEFGTIRFDQLFLLLSDSEAASTTAKFASIFLVVGAMTKSAQFPFHSWLPMTLETPTPVSALMHAGIVNAGGFLIIRMSPMLVHAPLALNLLAVVGTVSVLLGLVVMSTQTSIKKALAYSTVAQMGFMMLQCGLGAFSAAMLHILAHSIYKAHAFLNSGTSVARNTYRDDSGALGTTMPGYVAFSKVRWATLAAVSCSILAMFAGSLLVFQIDIVQKPGGLLLGSLFCV
ncbi:MAG: proton-conducting transporter membrane subunit, partial [Planctomycetota bacterium]